MPISDGEEDPATAQAISNRSITIVLRSVSSGCQLFKPLSFQVKDEEGLGRRWRRGKPDEAPVHGLSEGCAVKDESMKWLALTKGKPDEAPAHGPLCGL